jgi:NDP-sugar pyrophosphorylase family protein
MKAVVMAGGKGARLRPLTYSIPKPLLPVGDKPILEIIVGQLARDGFDDIFISTGYRAELIKTYFGDGSRFGVTVTYLDEDDALGTAGSLAYLKGKTDEAFLVLNGDILTKLRFRKLYDFHTAGGDASFTVACKRHEMTIPYGVIQTNGNLVTGVSEKPTVSNLVLAGMYVLEPRVIELLEPGKRCDIPQLLDLAITKQIPVKFFEVDDFWLDIGKMSDYEEAIKQMENEEGGFEF